jgi:hypothetical protein
VILYPGVPAQATALELTLFGPFWWVYWVLHIGLGVIVPIILLLTQTRKRPVGSAWQQGCWWSPSLPCRSISSSRRSLAVEAVEKGLIIAYQGPGLVPDYFPTVSEWLLTLFAMAFGFPGLFVWIPGAETSPAQRRPGKGRLRCPIRRNKNLAPNRSAGLAPRLFQAFGHRRRQRGFIGQPAEILAGVRGDSRGQHWLHPGGG